MRTIARFITVDHALVIATRLRLAKLASMERARPVAAASALVLTCGLAWATESARAHVQELEPFASVLAWLAPSQVPPAQIQRGGCG